MANKPIASDYLQYDAATNTYVMSADQAVRDDVEKHHWINVVRTLIKDWRLYIMLIPMILIFLFWRYFPLKDLLGSFKDSSKEMMEVAQQPFVGFAHFKTLLFGKDKISLEFWMSFRNTFLTSFYGLCFGFPMPILIALFFNEIKSNVMRSIYQVLTYLPKFMSTVIITTLLTLLLKPADSISSAGVVSKLLGFLGVSQTVVDGGLLNIPNYFRAIYQISGIWETAGYDSIVFFAAIIAVSPTSYEAAQIDGAGKLAQMRYVVLPSILSTVVIMLITRIGSLLNVGYEKVYLLTTSGNREVAMVVSTFSLEYGGVASGSSSGTNTANLHALATAAEMMNNIIGMVLVIGANTIAKKVSDVSLY